MHLPLDQVARTLALLCPRGLGQGIPPLGAKISVDPGRDILGHHCPLN